VRFSFGVPRPSGAVWGEGEGEELPVPYKLVPLIVVRSIHILPALHMRQAEQRKRQVAQHTREVIMYRLTWSRAIEAQPLGSSSYKHSAIAPRDSKGLSAITRPKLSLAYTIIFTIMSLYQNVLLHCTSNAICTSIN
jgi:hypothetical protein